MSQSTRSKEKPYWFQCLVNRNGVCVQRQGSINADYPYKAMKIVRDMAEKDWKLPIIDVAVYEINEEGEVGRQICKSSESGSLVRGNHTCEDRKPEPQPWNFGTYYSKKNYATLKLEDT